MQRNASIRRRKLHSGARQDTAVKSIVPDRVTRLYSCSKVFKMWFTYWCFSNSPMLLLMVYHSWQTHTHGQTSNNRRPHHWAIYPYNWFLFGRDRGSLTHTHRDWEKSSPRETIEFDDSNFYGWKMMGNPKLSFYDWLFRRMAAGRSFFSFIALVVDENQFHG